ncbi:hypothetical protein B9J96_10185 [Enterobacter roggenkampii]|nr:hypothetical protein B9J96_10185 [Enterobacter roggenkampii]
MYCRVKIRDTRVTEENDRHSTARIYHNVALRAPLRRPERVSDGRTVKQTTNHPKSRQKRRG